MWHNFRCGQPPWIKRVLHGLQRTYRAEDTTVGKILENFNLAKPSAMRGHPRRCATVSVLGRVTGRRGWRTAVRDRTCLVQRRRYAADEIAVAWPRCRGRPGHRRRHWCSCWHRARRCARLRCCCRCGCRRRCRTRCSSRRRCSRRRRRC